MPQYNFVISERNGSMPSKPISNSNSSSPASVTGKSSAQDAAIKASIDKDTVAPGSFDDANR